MLGKLEYGLVGKGDPGPIRVEGRSPGVLALHGFVGTPHEVRLVPDVARGLGLRSLAPLLPGHGTTARDLSAKTWDDWTAAASAALDVVAEDGPAIVSGLSMGAVLAAHLAATRPDKVSGLIAMGNAIWLPLLFPTLPLTLLARSPWRAADLYAPKVGTDITDRQARRVHLSYGANPIRAAIELLRGGRIVQGELSQIRCPTLVLHGARDIVCPPRNARRLADGLGTRDVEVRMLRRSAHILTVDLDRDEAASTIARFLRRNAVAPAREAKASA